MHSTHDQPPDEGNAIDGPMLLRDLEAGRFVRTNRAFQASLGLSATDLAQTPFLQWLHPADVAAARATLDGQRGPCEVRHRTATGGYVALNLRVSSHGDRPIVLARRSRASSTWAGPDDADDEATVTGTLHTIAQIVEEQNPGYKCSILLVADGRFVRGAGPSLPEEYNAAIDGFAIGSTVGSCGTAIYWNIPVVVEDIQNDPLWAPFAQLAERAGVHACWSHPFASRSGNVLGALALYSPVPRSPTDEQLSWLRAAAQMTGLAVERGRAEEAFRAKRKRELELEAQLRQAAKMEALGLLASGVAHDFKNVLTSIRGNAEFASELSPPRSEVQPLLANIDKACRRAGQFCEHLLAYAGGGTLVSTRFEIGTLLSDIGNLTSALRGNTILEYDLHDEPLYVDGDESQLLQVILNLVANAAQAIGSAEGRIVVTSGRSHLDEQAIRTLAPTHPLAPGDYVRLEIEDTGPGMDAATVARIFDPFFTTKATGHGLGLSAVQGIITKHGGAIDLETKLGEGTTFTVFLPAVDPPPGVSARTSADADRDR